MFNSCKKKEKPQEEPPKTYRTVRYEIKFTGTQLTTKQFSYSANSSYETVDVSSYSTIFSFQQNTPIEPGGFSSVLASATSSNSSSTVMVETKIYINDVLAVSSSNTDIGSASSQCSITVW